MIKNHICEKLIIFSSMFNQKCIFIKGGYRPLNFENTILTYGLGVMAWACTNNLRVVLSPWAKKCPSEASEQKTGQKPRTEQNEIELSCLHHSIRLDELIILMWSDVKIG